MNHFASTFGPRIQAFWNTPSEDEKNALLNDILADAGADPDRFLAEFRSIRFDRNIDPMPVVLEALSRDAAAWGHFYVEQLDAILEDARQGKDTEDKLSYLMEFSFIEKEEAPFTQEIVDRLHRALDSDLLSIRLAAICTLPRMMKNESIWNRALVIDDLQAQLQDGNWKIRCAAYTSLQFENLLPEGYERPTWDKLFPLVFGKGLRV